MKQSELLETQSGTNEKHESKPLLKQTPLTGSQFTMVESEKGIFLAIGKYRVTEPFETYEDLEQYMTESMWDLIGRMTVVMIGICDEIKTQEIQEKIKNQTLSHSYDGVNRTQWSDHTEVSNKIVNLLNKHETAVNGNTIPEDHTEGNS